MRAYIEISWPSSEADPDGFEARIVPPDGMSIENLIRQHRPIAGLLDIGMRAINDEVESVVGEKPAWETRIQIRI